MRNIQFISLLRHAAIAGNILFILWVTYNGIKEGFNGTLPEKFSYVGLMALLAINSFFLINKTKDTVRQS